MTRENIRPVAQAFGLLAAALLVLSVLYALFAWQAVQRERLGEVAGVARAGARATAHLLQSERQRFAMLADALAQAGALTQPEASARVLQQNAATRPGFGRIDLLDVAGRSVAASEAVPPTAATARETALLAGLAQARDHDGLQLGPVAWRDADRTWLPVTQRLVDAATGRTYGFLVAQIRIDGEAAWHHLQAPAHVRAGLVSDTGETLIHLAGPADETPRGPFWKWLEAHDRPRQGSIAIGDTFDVDLRHYAFERVDGHRITAFASVTQAALLRAWFDRVRVPFLVFALALAGLAFATAWTHRQQRQRETEQDAAATTLREQDGELRRQTALLSQTQRAAHVGGWELDPASGRLYWTDETYRIHEVLPDEFTPTVDNAVGFYTAESRELVRAALDKALRTGQSWDLELQLVTARGRPLWVRATGVAELGPRGVCAKVFGALQDVTERHRADERIRRLAHYDELTGLANRNLFTYHLGHVLSRAERYTKQLAVLFIDLDRFKIINDTLGHDTGDRVLETIARRLSEQMRASDLVARLSGDEFMVVVEEIEGPEVVEDVARKLLRAIEEPVQHQGQEFSLSGSIGIAVYPQDGRDQQSLLKHADIAMYRAKDQGKNGFEFYSSGMNAASVERFSLESRLKRAVVDQNQFVLHYQPKVSVADGRIVGAEALVRWVSPDRGLIPPGEFIPLAEETGLIGAIGEWVLTNACRQAAAWAEKGLPTVRVAVNLSARQLYSPGFLATVRQALADSGVNPGGMELEITESVMMHHVEQVAEVLGELKLLGVHVAVDDFGTGYSSLAYLKRLPLDSLKVDRSFVRDVPGDPDDEAITRAVVALAHSLRLKVVAEGVETEGQLGFLCELGCDEIQGFLFSRPVPAAEFEELLRRDARLPRPAGAATRAA